MYVVVKFMSYFDISVSRVILSVNCVAAILY